MRLFATAFPFSLWIPIAAILVTNTNTLRKFALTFTHCMHAWITPPGARIRAQGHARMQTHIFHITLALGRDYPMGMAGGALYSDAMYLTSARNACTVGTK